jgi:probable HAF family extracellular repeat protein
MRFTPILIALMATLTWLPIATLGSATSGVSAATTTYTLTDLGNLGGNFIGAGGINAKGQIVGTARTSGGDLHAFLYSDGAMRDLTPGAGIASQATAINDAGQIAGRIGDRATRWEADGATTDLGTLGGMYSTSVGIDANGRVVGQAQVPAPPQAVNGIYHAFVYADGAMRDLGTLPGGSGSSASAINDAGAIVGTADIPGGQFRATRFGGGGPIDLGILGRPASAYDGAPGSGASDINEAGRIVGTTSTTAGYSAFLWQDGTMRELPPPPGFASGGASAINNAGAIVGSASLADDRGASRAILWADGAAHDLNTLISAGSGWVLENAVDLNDLGQIVGNGKLGGQQRAFLLSPSICFAETGRCVGGRFLARWQQHGGLAINGYPISPEFVETLEDGKPYTVQYFERVRMELHPEHAPPNDVLLGQFGRLLHPADPPVAPLLGAYFYPETGHNVPADFQAFWDGNGGLPQFGYPLSEVIRERLEDGREYEVQYFERARFERHPENPPSNRILLGQFGRRIFAAR